ncbi:MAG: hypothetical protein HY908_26155 [Myxococcales bacterium]|nr:hypothetical protein [Myxococcales bacterium]
MSARRPPAGSPAGEPAFDAPGALRATAAGVELPAEETRALWQRFSAYMDEHRGDLPGFAASEGFAYAAARYTRGAAVLELAHEAPPPPPPKKPATRRGAGPRRPTGPARGPRRRG